MFPGPACKERGITADQLEVGDVPSVDHVTNGLALEIRSYFDKSGKTQAVFFNTLCKLNSGFSNSNQHSLINKLSRVQEQKRKLVSKKKVPGVKNVEELLMKKFEPVERKKVEPVERKLVNRESVIPCPEAHSKQAPISTSSPYSATPVSVHVQTDFDGEKDGKQLNLLQHKESVLTKNNKILTNKLLSKRVLLQKLDGTVGHYSVRNVNKRDATARSNLHQLRDKQRAVIRLEKQNMSNKEQLNKFKTKLSELQKGTAALRKQNMDLQNNFESTSEQLQKEREKKVAAQKANSYLKKKLSNAMEKSKENDSDHDNCNEKIVSLELELEQKKGDLDDVSFTETVKEDISSKNPDGSYTNAIRVCVIELAGLEVAVEKISPVIRAVSRHVFDKIWMPSELPAASSVQTFVDEGHFIAKTFISTKMDECDNWGLCRDGTTRKKQKIVDTSVTLDSGDVMSLGFTRVANETAKTIQKVTENQMKELSELAPGTPEQFIATSLEKLSFTMSDRASNEKLADKLLDEWRDEMLAVDETNKSAISNFHCMAHVLLGFHSYVAKELKVMEKTLVEQHGPIGRDALPVFKYWNNKKETFIERAVRTTADVFGPVGDHHGVRDKWEAYCSENGVKSKIGNYRDNRFNALFQTSAEIYLHKEQFLTVLQKVSKPNLKLQAVKTDLSATEVDAMLQCLGLFYLRVTGPYWNLITSGKVPYLSLYGHVQDVNGFLSKVQREPETLFESGEHWTDTDPLEIGTVPYHQQLSACLLEVKQSTRELLLQMVPVVASAMMATIAKQLVDFLPGGKFFDADGDEALLERTKFAPVTNLGCEHHFGDLDSSQRRRPNASYHHHSSVQLLKRNRQQLMEWVGTMDRENKEKLFLSARKGGRDLRKDHMRCEKDVLKEVHNNMTDTPKSSKRKSQGDNKSAKRQKKDNRDTFESITFDDKDFKVGECVVVAYQDRWYPGYIDNVLNPTSAVVKFMVPCRKRGYFQWPVRDDKQVVNKQFVIARDIVPDCTNSGRQWYISTCTDIDQLYGQFAAAYFA